jgi:hypothetical protein
MKGDWNRRSVRHASNDRNTMIHDRAEMLLHRSRQPVLDERERGRGGAVMHRRPFVRRDRNPMVQLPRHVIKLDAIDPQ